MTWVGLGAIGFSAVVFSANTAYPGTAVAVPVLGAGLVIAGGVSAPRWAAESVLGLEPFRWIGRLSYSLYLWHWPILIIAAESVGKASLPFRQNVVWLLVAVTASVVTYRLVENPIRHARILVRGWTPIVVGVLMITLSLAVATIGLNGHSGDDNSPAAVRAAAKAVIPASPSQLHQLLESAPKLRFLPSDLTPSLAQAGPTGGVLTLPVGRTRQAVSLTVRLWRSAGVQNDGDLWRFPRRDVARCARSIAKRDHWRLIDLSKGGCPADSLTYPNLPEGGPLGSLNVSCNQWHTFAIRRINQLNPSLLIITQDYRVE